MTVTMSIEWDKKALKEYVDSWQKGIGEAAYNTVGEMVELGKKSLLEPTATWNHKVEAKTPVIVNRADVTGEVTINDAPYYYVDKGTTVRRALLSANWKSKTTPGSLSATAGAGVVVKISKKFNFPGIEARDFSGQTFDRIDLELPKSFTRNLSDLGITK